MKKALTLLILITLFSGVLKAQQLVPYDRTRQNQVLDDRATWSRYFMGIPHGTTPSFPAYVPDSVKCGSLYYRTIDSALYVYNCEILAWEKDRSAVISAMIGAHSGIATLDGGGKVPFAQLPANLLIYKGQWDPGTNTPTLADSVGTTGWVYEASAAGSANFGAGSIMFNQGDFVIYNGSTWELSAGVDRVTSVNGQQGIVNLNTGNISEGSNLYFTNTRVATYGDAHYYPLSTNPLNYISNPMTTLGDIFYGGVSGVPTRLAGNTAVARMFLSSNGNGTVANAPAYFDIFNTSNIWSLTQILSGGGIKLINSAPIIYQWGAYPGFVAPATLTNSRNWTLPDSSGTFALTKYQVTITTISAIRALSGTLVSNLFRTTDIGQEGDWYYDSTDVSSADNTGTILVTSDGKRIKRVVSTFINVSWFGAKGDGTTNDATAIQNAVTYCKSFAANLSPGLIFKSNATYLVNSSIVIDGSVDIEGNGATIKGSFAGHNTQLTSAIFTLGTDSTIFNGNRIIVNNLAFTSASSTNLYGIRINGLAPLIQNCLFTNLTGSGIRAYYAQFTHIKDCAFKTNSRYGIEIYTTNVNTTGSNDVLIDGCYANEGNTLGGMYLQLQGSVIRKCTITDMPLEMHIEGYNNIIEGNTFESSSGASARTLLEISTLYNTPNTISACNFQGANTNTTPVKILTGSGKVIAEKNTFAISPVGAYFQKADNATLLSLFQNSYSNTASLLCSTNYNVSKSDVTIIKQSSLATTGAGPYFYTGTGFQLPGYGTFIVSITSGGNGNDYINHRGCHTFIVNYYAALSNYAAMNSFSGTGTQGATDMTGSISAGGAFSIVCQNTNNGVGAITATITQVGNSE